MNNRPKSVIELKAKMLCEGVNPDSSAEELFHQQNPSNVKRGGLSSGGKMRLPGSIFVNAPFYQKREVDLKITSDSTRDLGILIKQDGKILCRAEVLQAPSWYSEKVGEFAISQILTAHNRQLAAAVYENCALFAQGTQCTFCVMNHSLTIKAPALVKKSGGLILATLEKIPVKQYGGLTLNGGMTLRSGRGMEIIEPVVRAVHEIYPKLHISVEITPPEDLDWIDCLVDAGVASLMMNLECWDIKIRDQLIPGKNLYCSRDMYLRAFERALDKLGPGRVSTCFVVGTEPVISLKEGIEEVIKRRVIPSPLAGRYFEDIPDYSFVPKVDWREFLDVLNFTALLLRRNGIYSTDKAGCVACGMCDLIKDTQTLRDNTFFAFH